MKTCLRFVAVNLFMFILLSACSATPTPTSALPSAEPTLANTKPSASGACTSINMLYNERPPYMETSGQTVKGLTADPANRAFEQAGIPFAWVLTPSKRQLVILQDNQGCDCSLGWFKNPDREKFSLYTSPIYQDQPPIAIARADNTKIKSGNTVTDILSNADLLLSVKDGYSYGKFLDAQIAALNPKKDVTTAENVNMLEKVYKGYNDYFFIAPEEADGLITLSKLPKKDFQYVTFTDMPNGEMRYIICSKRVGVEVVDKLNRALATFITLP